jgi:hypothetical protein
MYRFLTATLSLTLATFAMAEEPSHCTPKERVAFTCHLKNNKVVSLCTAQGLTNTIGYIQYRYGPAGSIELEFPKSREKTQQQFELEIHHPYQTESELLNFNIGKYSYAVFRVVSSDAGSPTWAGIEITDNRNKNKPKTTTVECKRSLFPQSFGLNGAIPSND